MKEEAIDSLERVRDELRDAADQRRDPDRRRRCGRSTIVRREVRRALRLLVVATLALVVIAAFVPGRLGLGARIYAIVLCVTALALALMALRRAFPRGEAAPRGRSSARASSATSKPRRGSSMRQLLRSPSSFELHFRFAPRLRSIAAGLLASRRRISLDCATCRCARRPRRLRPGSSFARTDPRLRTGSLAASHGARARARCRLA